MREHDGLSAPTFRNNLLNWLIELFCNKPLQWHFRWRFRHNPAPGLEFQPFPDKHGRRYWLRVWGENDFTSLKVFYQGAQVGYVYLTWYEEENRVCLSDICLDEEHQKRGLGPLLLEQVVDLSRLRGIAEITGRVVGKDVADFPNLLSWYEAHGFAITLIAPNDPDAAPDDVASIRKLL